MTDDDPHHPTSDDGQASLRAELLGPVIAAQFEMERLIATLRASGAPLAEAQTQLGGLAALQREIATARPADFARLKQIVGETVANAAASLQQAQAAVTAQTTDTLLNAAQNSRTTVNAVIAGMKDFDRYLQFGPGDTEAEYRQREAERRAIIAAEQAKHTPEGDLNAGGAAIGQMADAAAHGAGENPEFQRRWDALVDSTAKLRAQLIRDGKDVSAFDKHLSEDLRTIMRAKGVPDAQIDALLAAHPNNPLDAMKAFVTEQKGVISEKEIGDFKRRASEYKESLEEKAFVAQSSQSLPSASVPESALNAMADLKAMGVIASAHEAGSPPAHGVSTTITLATQQTVAMRS